MNQGSLHSGLGMADGRSEEAPDVIWGSSPVPSISLCFFFPPSFPLDPKPISSPCGQSGDRPTTMSSQHKLPPHQPQRHPKRSAAAPSGLRNSSKTSYFGPYFKYVMFSLQQEPRWSSLATHTAWEKRQKHAQHHKSRSKLGIKNWSIRPVKKPN